MLRVKRTMGKREGKVQLFVICEKDWNQRLEVIREEKESGRG